MAAWGVAVVLTFVFAIALTATEDHVRFETKPNRITLIFPAGTEMTSPLAVSCRRCTLVANASKERFQYSGPVYKMRRGFSKVSSAGETRVTWVLHHIFPIRHLPFTDFTLLVSDIVVRYGSAHRVNAVLPLRTGLIPADFHLLYSQVSCDGSQESELYVEFWVPPEASRNGIEHSFVGRITWTSLKRRSRAGWVMIESKGSSI